MQFKGRHFFDQVHGKGIVLFGPIRVRSKADREVCLGLCADQVQSRHIVIDLGLCDAERALRAWGNEQLDQHGGALVFVDLAQVDLDRLVREGLVAQVLDEWNHAPDLARDDAVDQAQDQLCVLDNRSLHVLHGGCKVGIDLVCPFDVIPCAPAGLGNLVQQVFVPVLAQAQGLDDDPLGSHRRAQFPALIFVAKGLSVGEEQHAAQSIRGQVLFQLGQPATYTTRHGRAPSVADAVDLSFQAGLVRRQCAGSNGIHFVAKGNDRHVIVRVEQIDGIFGRLAQADDLGALHRAALVQDQRDVEQGLDVDHAFVAPDLHVRVNELLRPQDWQMRFVERAA